MSARHPVIAVTGSSGAGTTSVTRTFQWIFRRERIDAAIVEGDSFHRFDRLAMKNELAKAAAEGNQHYSHFGPYSNLFPELESLFRSYSETGIGKTRKYLHDEEEAAPHGQEPGTFTSWEDLPIGTDLLFYRAGHPEALVAKEAAHWDPILSWAANELGAVANSLRNTGLKVVSEKLVSIPQTPCVVSDLAIARQVLKLHDLLDDYPDTLNVFTNFEVADEILDQLAS